MLTQIIALLKTLMMKDTEPSELNKPWWQRRRTVHKILAVVGLVLYYKWGLVLDADMKSTITDNYEVIISSISALIAAVMTVWGVIGAIVGHVGQTKKLMKAVDACVTSTADQQKVTQEIADAINKDSMQFPAKKPDPMQHPALKPDSIPNDIDLPESPRSSS